MWRIVYGISCALSVFGFVVCYLHLQRENYLMASLWGIGGAAWLCNAVTSLGNQSRKERQCEIAQQDDARKYREPWEI